MTHYDIALIGSGSGNSFPGPEFADRSIVYIDRGVGPEARFGGTCLNVGCIPTKMFVHPANVARSAATAASLGVDAGVTRVDWSAMRDRIFGRIDAISAGGEEYRAHHEDNANLTLLRGTARFTGPRALDVELADGGTESITADIIVLAAGSRPTIPPIAGLQDLPFHTSDSIMRIDELPESLTILGTGIIAVEMAHVFAALGVDVTILARGEQLLRSADADVSRLLTDTLARRITLVSNVQASEARYDDRGFTVSGQRNGESFEVTSEQLLVATGRRPNSDLLAATEGGLGVDEKGYIQVDAYQRVLDEQGAVCEGIWALGDISNPVQLKHVANHELRIVRHNVLHPEDMRRSDTMPVPYGVFTSPPVGSVGLTEEQARAAYGDDVRVATQEYSSIAYGWAMDEPAGFAKIIARTDGTIVGAHVIGPEAPTLVQLLIQAMSTGQRVQDIARTQFWIHPAMPELIENALLQLAD